MFFLRYFCVEVSTTNKQVYTYNNIKAGAVAKTAPNVSYSWAEITYNSNNRLIGCRITFCLGLSESLNPALLKLPVC